MKTLLCIYWRRVREILSLSFSIKPLKNKAISLKYLNFFWLTLILMFLFFALKTFYKSLENLASIRRIYQDGTMFHITLVRGAKAENIKFRKWNRKVPILMFTFTYRKKFSIKQKTFDLPELKQKVNILWG